MKCHCTCTSVAKKVDDTKFGGGCRVPGALMFANSTDILENTLAVSNKVQHTLTQPSTLLLCIYPGEIEKKFFTKTCIRS